MTKKNYIIFWWAAKMYLLVFWWAAVLLTLRTTDLTHIFVSSGSSRSVLARESTWATICGWEGFCFTELQKISASSSPWTRNQCRYFPSYYTVVYGSVSLPFLIRDTLTWYFRYFAALLASLNGIKIREM